MNSSGRDSDPSFVDQGTPSHQILHHLLPSLKMIMPALRAAGLLRNISLSTCPSSSTLARLFSGGVVPGPQNLVDKIQGAADNERSDSGAIGTPGSLKLGGGPGGVRVPANLVLSRGFAASSSNDGTMPMVQAHQVRLRILLTSVLRIRSNSASPPNRPRAARTPRPVRHWPPRSGALT